LNQAGSAKTSPPGHGKALNEKMLCFLPPMEKSLLETPWAEIQAERRQTSNFEQRKKEDNDDSAPGISSTTMYAPELAMPEWRMAV
jgi:hypothetical protein